MATWTQDELDAIGTADELQITSSRSDGSTRNPVTIWVVRIGDELYVRSVRGQKGAWYRGAERSHEGHVEAGGIAKDVSLVDVGTNNLEQIDGAYKEKYGYPSENVDGIITPEAQATTTRLQPR
ncbi:MAG TPA: DUF2255 family protein [Solirubrobacterales bacterium]|nr:DUF2255 family protein [Solirubrobacterales bacterium]